MWGMSQIRYIVCERMQFFNNVCYGTNLESLTLSEEKFSYTKDEMGRFAP